MGILDDQRGGDFKHFTNLQVLKEVESRVPEEARLSIQSAQDNTLIRLQNDLEQLDQAKQATFEDFVNTVGGNETVHLEIINQLE